MRVSHGYVLFDSQRYSVLLAVGSETFSNCWHCHNALQ